MFRFYVLVQGLISTVAKQLFMRVSQGLSSDIASGLPLFHQSRVPPFMYTMGI